MTQIAVYISLLVMLCGICARTALHISSVTSSGETQAVLLGNLIQEDSTVTQQFHTTLNTTLYGHTESAKVGEMVPFTCKIYK